jgi:hypothetical protein
MLDCFLGCRTNPTGTWSTQRITACRSDERNGSQIDRDQLQRLFKERTKKNARLVMVYKK